MSLESDNVGAYSILMPLAPWEPPLIVRQALESLKDQTFPASQVIVSCDGPPPRSLREQLEQVRLPLEIVLGPGGEGVGPVLARGLERCRHDLVVRADADDVSLPQRCATQVSWMLQHPEVMAMGCLIDEFCHSPDQVVSQRLVPIRSEKINREARWRNPLNHPSVILRRSAVQSVGNYRSKPGFEDYDLWLRLLKTYGSAALANSPEALVRVRVGAAHLGRRHGWRYALAEGQFFIACAREGLLRWGDVVRNLTIRFPLRLLPNSLLAWVMVQGTRREVGRKNGQPG